MAIHYTVTVNDPMTGRDLTGEYDDIPATRNAMALMLETLVPGEKMTVEASGTLAD